MYTIVLVGPESAGNIGSVCRAMKNFGFSDLVIVSPKCDLGSDEAISRAMHARDILDSAKVKQSLDFLDGFGLVVAFTSKITESDKILRSPIPLKDMVCEMESIDGDIALVFGRESKGLTNPELRLCDIASFIETSEGYPALNLAHAVCIVLREIFSCSFEGIPKIIASPQTKQSLLRAYDNLVDSFGNDFRNPQAMKVAFRRIVAKSEMSEKEAKSLLTCISRAQKG